MNTQRVASRMSKEDIANVGAQENQVPPLEEVSMDDQILVAKSVYRNFLIMFPNRITHVELV